MHSLAEFHHPTGATPTHVILLCLGETKREYADILSHGHDRRWPRDSQIWTLNAGFRIWRHDLLFVMDDLELEHYKWPSYGEDLAAHDRPIITSTAYPHWPQAVNYPFDWICQKLGLTNMDRYFFNSVPLILAYALAIGVKRMTVFGADYHHPNQPGREAHFGNANYWMGFCRARGMEFELASDTTLMDARYHAQPMYGYRFDPRTAADRRQRRRTDKNKSEAQIAQTIPQDDGKRYFEHPDRIRERPLSAGAEQMIHDADHKIANNANTASD